MIARHDLNDLKSRALTRWVPVWMKGFRDTTHGGFHERLDQYFQPIDMGYKRLLTQCRQIYVYSHAMIAGGADYSAELKSAVDFLITHYQVKDTGGWRFSVLPDGTAKDNHYDLYGHAFVVMAMGFYHRATQDPRALPLARSTMDFINTHFRVKNLSGFIEELDENLISTNKMRRQNPHMHLLEACLFMKDACDDPVYMDVAREIYGLFTHHFYDSSTDTVIEYLTDDLQPHPEQGLRLESGHNFEWIWLLQKYAEKTGQLTPGITEQMNSLYAWANAHVYDRDKGGIFYEVARDSGRPLSRSKRLWPVAEAMKADAIMKHQVSTALLDRYIADNGSWIEMMNEDMAPASDYMPASTPYHVFIGIMEAERYLVANADKQGKNPQRTAEIS